MAKKKKKAKKKKAKKTKKQMYAELLAPGEIESIIGNLEAAIEVKGECQFCGETYEDSDDSGLGEADAKADSAKNMHKLGWREVNSKEWALTGLACPKCFKQPDEKRGKW